MKFFLALGLGLLAAGVVWGQQNPLEMGSKPKMDPAVAATLVIYNSRDLMSSDLAIFYAQRRGIPADHLVGLNCSMQEEISRAEYDSTIAEPLRKIFKERGWWTLTEGPQGTRVDQNQIRFVALMRGMPLKIAQVDHYDGDDEKSGLPSLANINHASVDSELASLGYFTRHISGALKNPYYDGFAPILDIDMPALMLVCRLDGPSDEVVKRMIVDSITTERTGLWGLAYVNERGVTDGGLAMGDQWMKSVERSVTEHGIPCIVQSGPALFAANYPMNHVALYYGWYSGTVAGPFARQDFQFVRGAVAVHIHSFSANTLRDPNANWVAPLLAHGAAATLGNVYEPYLYFTTHLDLLNDRLLNGFTFAESCYMSQNVVSWMSTFVGDPLYRPFKAMQDFTYEAPKSDAAWAVYREGALAWFNKGRAVGESQLQASGKTLRSGVIFEGLGLLQMQAGDSMAALKSWVAAEKYYSEADDILRVEIHEVRLLRAVGRAPDAAAVVRRAFARFPDAPALKVLRSDATGIP